MLKQNIYFSKSIVIIFDSMPKYAQKHFNNLKDHHWIYKTNEGRQYKKIIFIDYLKENKPQNKQLCKFYNDAIASLENHNATKLEII